MRVLFADAFESSGLDRLRGAGCEVLYRPGLKDSALAEAIVESGADVLVVRGTRVTAAMLERGSLSLVVRAGAGYNTIDVAAASRRGIYVSNCPGRNAVAVAELTLGLIVALDRRIPDNVADLRAQRWNKKEYSQARGLFGRTLGLIGYGNIAQEVARRAHAFGMPIIVWSRRFGTSGSGEVASGSGEVASGFSRTITNPPFTIARSPEDVAAQADVLSVHLALTPETRGLIGAAVLDRLRPGALFVNTARAELVDAAALERAVRERGVRAGLDVFLDEPAGATGPFSNSLTALPGVYGTHHIGASTEQAQNAIADEAARIITVYQATGKVPNVVNLARRTPATHVLAVRHRDRPGVLAHVFGHLREAGLNVQETENVVFDGAEAAVARINIDAAPAPAVLQAIRRGNDDVLDVHVVTMSYDSDSARS